jgi:predicted tellurium resistance membrane protein TerC
MSLDNVLAVAGTAHGDLLLVGIGIGLTIPLVVFGSTILGRMMERWPAIVWLGGGILGYVAGTLIVADDRIHAWFGKPENEAAHPLPIAAGVLFTMLGWWNARRSRARVPA